MTPMLLVIIAPSDTHSGGLFKSYPLVSILSGPILSNLWANEGGECAKLQAIRREATFD